MLLCILIFIYICNKVEKIRLFAMFVFLRQITEECIFMKFLYWGVLLISINSFQFWLKSDSNNGYLT
jgi:hypothetical protein